MVEQELEFPQSHEIEFIVPTKAVNELQRLLGEDGEVTIRVSGSQAGFDMGRSLLVTELIEGNYPNYRQVIRATPRSALPWSASPSSKSISVSRCSPVRSPTR